MNEYKDILVPIISVVFSGITAIIVARIQVNATLKRLDAEYQRKATELLFQKRLEVYPHFHSLLLSMIKKGKVNGLTYDDLNEFVIQFDHWEIDNAIYVSPLGLEKVRRTRIVLNQIIDEQKTVQYLSNKKLKKLLAEFYSIQMSLKTELGVIDADSFHNPTKTKRFNEIINFEMQPDN